MALERVPADIRRDGGVARMSDPALIEAIKAAVTIPVMAKARIGHFAEAQVLEALGVDYIDESEVLTPADEAYHIDKWAFTVPFVCGATNLGEALRRISEGAAMIRSKGEAGTGDVKEAVRHLRSILGDIRGSPRPTAAELYGWAKALQAPVGLVQELAETGRLPVPLFCAGGIATPADAALVMQLGAEAVFVGSGIFKSSDPPRFARAIVEATTHYRDAGIVAKVSRGLGDAMRGQESTDVETQAFGAGLVAPLVAISRWEGSRQVGGKIGVLALQGDVREHVRVLSELGAHPVEVRQPADLPGSRRARPARRRVHGHLAAAGLLRVA